MHFIIYQIIEKVFHGGKKDANSLPNPKAVPLKKKIQGKKQLQACIEVRIAKFPFYPTFLVLMTLLLLVNNRFGYGASLCFSFATYLKPPFRCAFFQWNGCGLSS